MVTPPDARVPPDAVPAPLLRELVDAIAYFPLRTRERGRVYVEQGRVGSVEYASRSFGARVRGTAAYRSRWDWSERHGWDAQCTCPVGAFCKHAYAVACTVLADARAGGQIGDARLTTLLPRVEPAAPARAAVTWLPPPRAPERTPNYVRQLRAARHEWERQSALDRLLAGAPVIGLSPYAPPLMELLGEPDPDLLCWRLAEQIPLLADGWLPATLEPYRGRADLAARYAARERDQLAADLVRWAEQRRAVRKRSLRVLLAIAPREPGVGELLLEVRVSTPRMVDVPRHLAHLQQFRTDAVHSPGVFAPEQTALLDWIGQHCAPFYGGGVGGPHRLTTPALAALLDQIADSSLATWADDLDPDLAARVGIVPGGPVRVRRDAAKLLPECVQRDGGFWLELRFVWGDGQRRSLAEAVLLPAPGTPGRSGTSLVLADGALSAVIDQPPPAVARRFRVAGGLPLAAAGGGELLGALAPHFPNLQETLAAHTRLHPAAPLVALDLREDDWLQVRVFARTAGAWEPGRLADPSAVVFEHTPARGWVPCPASGDANPAAEPDRFAALRADPAAPAAEGDGDQPAAPAAPPPAEVWVDAPDPRSVEPALTWLQELPVANGAVRGPAGRIPNWPDRDVGWWMQANRRTMQRLAEAWEGRPAGVAYFGTPRIRRLLDGGRSVAARLRVSASGVDWLAVSAEWAAEGLQLRDADLAKLRDASARFVKLDCGWVRKDVATVHDEVADVLADLGIEPGGGEQRLSVWQLAGASPATLQALDRLGADAGTAETLRRLREQVEAFAGLPEVPLPAGLTATLRPYQRAGLDFLAYTAELGVGAILADDMGLGKTVQALAWLLHLRERDPDGGPSLVVCPASVLHNWVREAEHFAPDLRVLPLTSGKTRHALRSDIPQHDLVVTNYALLRRDIEAWRAVPLRAAILDEAQFIKNPDAAVSRAALDLQARYRLALTGTPLENRALDLWSIMSFAAPGYLGPRAQFQTRYDRADAPRHTRALLAAKLRPVLLRRTKGAVAPELPERIEERRDCELTREQRQLYLAELQRSRVLLDEVDALPGGVARHRIHILAALTRLRQICCHPLLAGGKAHLGSGKFDALFELLEPLLAEGHKVLLFSQFVQCLKLLEREMRARHIGYHLLTGQTTKREQVVAAFQGDPDPCVFLVSLKAGGTGLNLTSASYVVLFDPWWNPAVEAQAIDRTHRIGQDRTVIAYRLLASGTIEEKIWELQQRKAALVEDVLGEGGFARSLTRDDLAFLLAEV